MILAISCKNDQKKVDEEVLVYNEIIDSLYISYSNMVILNRSINIDSLDKIYYSKTYDYLLNQQRKQIDSLEQITIVMDSLKELSVNSNNIKHLIDTALLNTFSDLIKDNIFLPAMIFDIKLLKQNKVRFIKSSAFSQDSIWILLKNKRQGHQYYHGVLEISRVKFDKSKTKCILECGFIASSRAGAGYLFLLQKENNIWIIKQKIQTWIS